MAKKNPRIDQYLKHAAPFAGPILKRLRRLVHQGCPEVEESIKWQMPFFLYDGKILCFFAEFKAHINFGFWGPAMKKFLASEGVEARRGLLGRIESEAGLPDDRTLLRYIKQAKSLHDSGASVRVVRPRKPALASPPDLIAALRRNAAAAGHWEKFSPSARRDYIEWITEAKRAETREERLLTTIEWAAEGKRRNWKYEKC
ncbi:MAG: YdeI/OmpD-associated family protein [Lacunisphaera sp.]